MAELGNEIVVNMLRERDERHAEEHPDGCPDWCERCRERLECRNGRHEWPRDFSDGDTCFCGEFYLHANAINERPHIQETPHQGARE